MNNSRYIFVLEKKIQGFRIFLDLVIFKCSSRTEKQLTYIPYINRVTRLGEFSPIGGLFC
jgi:hypothetical protein